MDPLAGVNFDEDSADAPTDGRHDRTNRSAIPGDLTHTDGGQHPHS